MAGLDISQMSPAMGICVIFTMITLLLLSIVYLCFGIYYLVKDQNVCEQFSPLWVYSFVALLLVVVGQIFVYFFSEFVMAIGSRTQRQLYSWTLLELALTAYGIIIIMGFTCEEMTTKGLYVWATVTLAINGIAALVLIISLLALPYYMPDHNKEESIKDSEDEAEPVSKDEESPLFDKKN
jgi:hypothetical protein